MLWKINKSTPRDIEELAEKNAKGQNCAKKAEKREE